MAAMKRASVIFLFLAFGLCGCEDQRVPALEKRIADLEKRVNTLEEVKKQSDESTSQYQADFKNCVDQANDDYFSSIRNNGTKNRDGTYAVDMRIVAGLERQKQNKLEECRLLYK